MTEPSAIKVFVSVGRASTPQQEQFVSAIEAYMIDRGLKPQTLGRNYWSSRQPLLAVGELMTECAGAAVIAFERLRIVEGVDRRGSPAEKVLRECALPSVWNQIEAAQAHSRGLPLLVLIEQDLRAEGLLETTNDWYVKRLPLTAEATSDREFVGVFDDWHTRVKAYHETNTARLVKATTKQIGGSPTIEAAGASASLVDRRELRTMLDEYFDNNGVRELCFDLNVDDKLLRGAKQSRTIRIISYFEREGRTSELIAYVKKLHPEPQQKESPSPQGGKSSPRARSISVSDSELKELLEALLDGFPTTGDLDQMVRLHMNLNLHEIASGNLSDQAFGLIRYSKAHGLLGKLLESAVDANAGNPKLRRIAAAHGL